MSITLSETIELLEGKSITPIANATGLSYQWIWMLRKGQIPNPGLKNLNKLQAYLTKQNEKLSTESDPARAAKD